MAKKKKMKAKAIQIKGPLEWLYIEEKDSTLQKMYETLKSEVSFTVEYWEEAGVLEISVENGGNLDFEMSEEDHVYWVNVSAKAYDEAIAAMKMIESACGGQFIVDGGE